MSNMDHMNFIRSIALSDVDVLHMKETTYRGSWKKAGGRSAWFMMRRNMDRLLSMMAPPATTLDRPLETVLSWTRAIENGTNDRSNDTVRRERADTIRYMMTLIRSEDIFAKIEENPFGTDGTVLACLRDLRRYLLLIESEMIARGVANIEVAQPPLQARDERGCDKRAGKTIIEIKPATETTQGTPEDGGHHETDIDDPWLCDPWIIAKKKYDRRVTSNSFAEQFYERRAVNIYKLIPFVVASQIPRSLRDFYTRVNESVWAIKIENVPNDIRCEFPRLQSEMNSVEFDQSPRDAQFMYYHDASTQKFILKNEFAAWGRD